MTQHKSFSIKEIILYAIAGAGSLFILGYSVHMLIGDLVSPAVERWAILITCLLGIMVIAYMVWDVIRHRKKQSARKFR